MHKHLRRLECVWVEYPIYFIATCTFHRKPILARKPVAEILIDEWNHAHNRHGWTIGRYVIMPDHLHFFCAPELDAKPLSQFVGFWKEWTGKRIKRAGISESPIWQEEFFDHVLRSNESYTQKWDYVRENPIRAGLVKNAASWPWQGEIETLRL